MAANMGNTIVGTTTVNTDTATINDTTIGTLIGTNTEDMKGATTMSICTTETKRDMAGTNTGMNPDIAGKSITHTVESSLIPDVNTVPHVAGLGGGGIMDGAVSAVGGVDPAGCAENVTSVLKNPAN